MITRLIMLLIVVVTASPAVADTRCAMLRDGIIVAYQNVPPSDLAAPNGCWPDAPRKNIKWLPAPKAEKPAYDPATQVLEGPTVAVTKDAVTESYTVRDKTAQELAAETEARKESILSDAGELVLRRLCDHENRILVLEGKSAVTWEQCRKAIKDSLK
jgi:hypothetical protein